MMRVVIENGGTDWLTPLATLLAVIVGGLLNWVAQRWLADKRVDHERQVAKDQTAADAAVQARIDEAEMRTAARLIQADLSVAVGHLKTIPVLNSGRQRGRRSALGSKAEPRSDSKAI